jgi:hypothetical protein
MYILAWNRKFVLRFHEIGSQLLQSDFSFLYTLVFRGVVKNFSGHRTIGSTTTVRLEYFWSVLTKSGL